MEKPIAELLGLNSEIDPKKKAKSTPIKSPLKGSNPSEFVDKDLDDNDKRLPKVFIDSTRNTFNGYQWNNEFKEINTSMISVFHMIKRYQSSIIINNEDKTQSYEYLWQLIYPKSKDNKPCYNPNRKYAIKLYFAGKWRKIIVYDNIPVCEDGSLALVSSIDSYELWPTLIAKAIYSLYYSAG